MQTRISDKSTYYRQVSSAAESEKEKQLLIQHLRMKEEKLDIVTHQVVESQTLMRDAVSEIRQVIDSLPLDRRKLMRALIARLEYKTGNDQTWRIMMNANSQSFLEDLAQKHPTLTDREREVCVFCRNSSFDGSLTAHILDISIKTLHRHRYNIRRKLGLSINQSLSKFLQSL